MAYLILFTEFLPATNPEEPGEVVEEEYVPRHRRY
jgi:hypothetical protein